MVPSQADQVPAVQSVYRIRVGDELEMTTDTPATGGEMDVDQGSGLARERKDSRQIGRSLNPEKVRIRTIDMTIDRIVSRVARGETDLISDSQRNSGKWDRDCKSHLIESILLRIPIPALYVAENENCMWSIIDGFHRISAIHDYVTNLFPLSNFEYFPKFNGCSYERLPRSMQRRIDETPILVHIVEPGAPEEVMLNIYRRINPNRKY